VIDVDLLSVIRRWHHRDKLPIREIRRRTGLSRNTIRKYLAIGDVPPAEFEMAYYRQQQESAMAA
jgi:hypothetical protein